MNILRTLLFAVVFAVAALAVAASVAKPSGPPSQSSALPANEVDQQWMLEGEKRYRTNCGRCHQPPHKYSPRAMAMAVRHMRVRAMLTEDDMRYVLYYVTH
jgi:cytochrome c5